MEAQWQVVELEHDAEPAGNSTPHYCDYRGDCGLAAFVMVLAGLAITAAGVVGNAVAAAILTRWTMRSPVNLLLLAVIVTDLHWLMINAVFSNEQAICYLRWHTGQVMWLNAMPLVYPVNAVTTTANGYMTVALALWPLLETVLRRTRAHRCLNNINNAGIATAVVTACAILINMTKPFEFTVGEHSVCPVHTWRSYTIGVTSFGASRFNRFYRTYINYALMLELPYVLLLIFCALLLPANYRTRRLERRTRTVNGANAEGNGTNVCLVIAVALAHITSHWLDFLMWPITVILIKTRTFHFWNYIYYIQVVNTVIKIAGHSAKLPLLLAFDRRARLQLPTAFGSEPRRTGPVLTMRELHGRSSGSGSGDEREDDRAAGEHNDA